MTDAPLPAGLTWQEQPFPDANLLLLTGRQPTLVDSGFVGHADQTATWVHTDTDDLALVVDTHWHAADADRTRTRPASAPRSPGPGTQTVDPVRAGQLEGSGLTMRDFQDVAQLGVPPSQKPFSD